MSSALIGLLAGLTASAAPTSPPVRLAVVLTSNIGLSDETPLRYADTDGRRVSEVLRELGGFNDEDVFEASDAHVDDVTAALAEATVRAVRLRKEGREVTLLVYYTGHAGADGLHLYDEVLPLPELKTASRVVPATERLFTIDACQSGQFFRSKGARLVPLPSSELQFSPPPGEAWLTSSGAEESAFEVDNRRGSLFTHFFISGVRGAADRNGDRRVTLAEVQDFVSLQTETEAARLGYLQQPQRAGGLDDLVLTDLDRATAGITINGPISEPLLVVGHDAVVAGELPAGAGGQLALPEGRYQLLAMAGGRPKVADIVVSRGEFTVVDASTLRTVRGIRSKGGLVVAHPWSVSGGYALTMGPTAAASQVHGLWLGSHRVLGRGHQLGVVASAGAGSFSNDWVSGRELLTTAGLEWTWDLAWRNVRLGPGLRLGGGWLDQTSARRDDTPWGDWYGGATASQQARMAVGQARVLLRASVPAGPVSLRIIAGLGPNLLSNTPLRLSLGSELQLGVEVPL